MQRALHIDVIHNVYASSNTLTMIKQGHVVRTGKKTNTFSPQDLKERHHFKDVVA